MKSMAQRVADRAIVTEAGCWLWTGAKAKNGYGSVTHNGRRQSAHKATYEELIGNVPDGNVVMHTCDRKSCVNPAHMRVGSYAENTADMVLKGRQGVRQRKLSQEDVDAVRSMCASGLSQQLVASLYGVSQTCVSQIVRRITYDDWYDDAFSK